MRTKWFSMLIAFCMLVAHASAQPYPIRANRGLNLRAEPSLNADIADTITAGTVLQVVGKFHRWLKVDRTGREVWLADWVDFSRVDERPPAPNPQPASSPPANVDNCCFVDRQCNSDQDWIDGYWAYQFGQCAAPAQPQPVTPAQPVAGAPANVDNCCYVDRQCQSDWDWINGFYAYQNGQCAAPVQAQPATPAQPADSRPASIYNCCDVDRHCQSEAEWIAGRQAFRASECVTLLPPTNRPPASGGNCCDSAWQCMFNSEREQGYWVYQINQCAGLPNYSAVALTGPVPRIEGSGRFVQHIGATLKLMKSIAPAWYNYVITAMDLIVESGGRKYPGHCAATAYARERKVTVESCWIDWVSAGLNIGSVHNEVATARTLGHEACHIHRHEEGFVYDHSTSEHEEEMCDKFGSGASALLSSALTTGLNPRRGTTYFDKDVTLRSLRQYCSEGYRADLFCPTLQRLESIWRNVPYSVFPPRAP